MRTTLTRRQQEIYDFLVDNEEYFPHPPTLAELCEAMNLSSRGSMHKQVQALIEAGLVEPMNGQRRGIRLAHPDTDDSESGQAAELPFLGKIAAGRPLEAVTDEHHRVVVFAVLSAVVGYVLAGYGPLWLGSENAVSAAGMIATVSGVIGSM